MGRSRSMRDPCLRLVIRVPFVRDRRTLYVIDGCRSDTMVRLKAKPPVDRLVILSPHQFTPVSGAHKSASGTVKEISGRPGGDKLTAEKKC